MSSTVTKLTTTYQEVRTEAASTAASAKKAAEKHKKIITWVLISGAIFVGVIIVIVLLWFAITQAKKRLGGAGIGSSNGLFAPAPRYF